MSVPCINTINLHKSESRLQLSKIKHGRPHDWNESTIIYVYNESFYTITKYMDRSQYHCLFYNFVIIIPQ